MTELRHREIQELLGAFAIDAVDDDEAVLIGDHLRACPRCQAEVDAHRQTAAFLAFEGQDAPDTVWDRIQGGLDGAPAEPALPMLLRRPTPPRGLRVLAAAAMVMVVALGGLVIDQARRIDRLESGQTIDRALAAAVRHPDAREVALTSTDGSLAASAVLLPDGTGFLVSGALPAVAADQTYQLWGVQGPVTVSLGVLGRDPVVAPFKAAPGTEVLALTVEVAGGVVSSTQPPVVLGRVPRSA